MGHTLEHPPGKDTRHMNPSAASAAPEPHDVWVNGVMLHYATWGTYTTPERAVALIHGITSNHLAFAVLGPALAAEGWYAIAPDLRGRGLSGKPPHGYGIGFHANDLLALCDSLNLPTITVVGHSLGAFIAMYLGALYGPRIGKLVFVDGGGRIPPDAYDTVASSVKRLENTYPSLDAFIDSLRAAAPFTWDAYWDAYYRYDAEVLPDGTVRSRMPLAAYMEEVGANATLNPDVLLPFIKAPTLITRASVGTKGPDSGFILTPDEAQRLVSTLPDCRTVDIAGANHYTITTTPQFVQEVVGFLRG
jgi:pimeloyl-ACP methyl ester carboxylesterase